MNPFMKVRVELTELSGNCAATRYAALEVGSGLLPHATAGDARTLAATATIATLRPGSELASQPNDARSLMVVSSVRCGRASLQIIRVPAVGAAAMRV